MLILIRDNWHGQWTPCSLFACRVLLRNVSLAVSIGTSKYIHILRRIRVPRSVNVFSNESNNKFNPVFFLFILRLLFIYSLIYLILIVMIKTSSRTRRPRGIQCFCCCTSLLFRTLIGELREPESLAFYLPPIQNMHASDKW